jgi:eukaryotic-like serine/threonine-protein kinase
VKLQRGIEWVISERLEGGGFGQVHAAKSAEYESAVAKLVPKVPGAERELLFADLQNVRNVVPIIDQGETEDTWVLVMPRAEKSLRKFLREVGGPLDVPGRLRHFPLCRGDDRPRHQEISPHWRSGL